MKILITNPRLILVGKKIIVKGEIAQEQLVRQIEKLLLSKSIIPDKIEVVK